MLGTLKAKIHSKALPITLFTLAFVLEAFMTVVCTRWFSAYARTTAPHAYRDAIELFSPVMHTGTVVIAALGIWVAVTWFLDEEEIPREKNAAFDEWFWWMFGALFLILSPPGMALVFALTIGVVAFASGMQAAWIIWGIVNIIWAIICVPCDIIRCFCAHESTDGPHE